jgi:hypothetical protein
MNDKEGILDEFLTKVCLQISIEVAIKWRQWFLKNQIMNGGENS